MQYPCLKKILSTVYKMSHIDGKDVMKVSNDEGKMSYPGNKNVYRLYEAGNVTDVVTLTEGEEIGLKCGGNAKKLTVDYIIDGKICEDNVKSCLIWKNLKNIMKVIRNI